MCALNEKFEGPKRRDEKSELNEKKENEKSPMDKETLWNFFVRFTDKRIVATIAISEVKDSSNRCNSEFILHSKKKNTEKQNTIDYIN